MFDHLLTEPILAGVGLATLAVLCLPLSGIQRLILEVAAWSLRLALLALLASAGYLLFRPEELPAEVIDTLSALPAVWSRLPESGTPAFVLCLAVPVVLALLPVLAALDICRQLSGGRLRRLRALVAARAGAAPPAVVVPAASVAPRPVGRREAANAMAAAVAGKPTVTHEMT